VAVPDQILAQTAASCGHSEATLAASLQNGTQAQQFGLIELTKRPDLIWASYRCRC
jgi:hypothetical protein